MKQALLVIDVQESFRHRPYFSAQGLPGFLANVQALIDRCQARALPVVQVFHRELPDDAANPSRLPPAWCGRCPSCRCSRR